MKPANTMTATTTNNLVTILYGSQTGNAEDLAKRIGHRAKCLGFNVLVETMDDFSLKLLPKQNVVIFVCSTTGHGQEPENMKNLYNFMRRRDLPGSCLSSLNYAVYGLGDSSYAKFNYVAKILFKRLKECGAKPIQELVAGDEQHQFGCDGVIYPKLNELWLKLYEKLGGSIVNNQEVDYSYKDNLPSNSYDALLYQKGSTGEMSGFEVKFKLDFISKYNIRTAYCKANCRLTANNHFQDTRFFRFRVDETIDYEPGDVCSILPTNSDENTDLFLKTLDLDPEQRISIRKKDSNYMVNYLYDFIPDGLIVRELVKYYLDIQSVPRRSFFEFMWPFADDNELEREKLKEFASTEGQEEMYEYCVQPKRSILEVLLDFPHTVKNIKFGYLLDLIPPIKPRSFSIASASKIHPNEVHLIVGVVNYQTRMRKIRRGLCSNYLARLVPVQDGERAAINIGAESRLHFFIRSTSFKLPDSLTVPIIMIGPGLGIAPFRSFIEARWSSKKGRVDSCDHLYFGCRKLEADFYFRDELEQFEKDGYLKLRVAFSREEPKQYVQDLLLEDSKLVKDLIIIDKAMVYIAGNSRLPEELRKLLGKILTSETGDTHTENEADRLVALLESQNRIQYDCW